MTKKKGRMIYVPPSILDEAHKIMQTKRVKRVQALRDMTKYSRVGREAEAIYKLNFNPINIFKAKKRKKR